MARGECNVNLETSVYWESLCGSNDCLYREFNISFDISVLRLLNANS